jgi:phosphoenolpyruvate phosphomutase
MLDIKGKTILERQVSALRECGISDIVIVRGYKAEKINLTNVRYYDNIHYQQGYILSSLFEAEQEMNHPFIFLYGDIIFDKSILEKLMQAKGDVRLVIDRAWVDQFLSMKEVALKRKPELVTTDQTPPKSHRFLPSEQLTQGSHVLKIGSQLDPQQAHGEFIGMAFFSKEGACLLKEIYHRMKGQFEGKPFHEAAEFQWASVADLIQEMIHQGISVTAVETYKGWMEIDTFDDYYRALASFLPSNTPSSSPISRGTEKTVTS